MTAELQQGVLLLAELPYEPGKRQMLKLSYDASHRTGRAHVPGSGFTRLRVWLAEALNRLGAGTGLVGRVEIIDDLAVGLGASYHAEAIPPADAFVAEADLKITRAPLSKPGASAGPPEREFDWHRYRPHLRVVSHARGDTGRLRLVFHAHREALVAPLWLSALAICAMLALLPGRLTAQGGPASLDAQTLAAVLLVPVALAATTCAQPSTSTSPGCCAACAWWPLFPWWREWW